MANRTSKGITLRKTSIRLGPNPKGTNKKVSTESNRKSRMIQYTLIRLIADCYAKFLVAL